MLWNHGTFCRVHASVEGFADDLISAESFEFLFMWYIKLERQCFIGISKHREEGWKYDAQWIADDTLPRVLDDISSPSKQKLRANGEVKSSKSMAIHVKRNSLNNWCHMLPIMCHRCLYTTYLTIFVAQDVQEIVTCASFIQYNQASVDESFKFSDVNFRKNNSNGARNMSVHN